MGLGVVESDARVAAPTGWRMLIAVEGIDGAGKTTQAIRLAAWLGPHVVLSREPTSGPHGSRIREAAMVGERLTSGEELALFLADRRQHVDEVIRPALAAGDHVVLDRYVHSTVAYQGTTDLRARALLVKQRSWAPWPDLTVWLDVPVAVALERIAGRGVSTAFERRRTLELAMAGFERALALDRVVVRVDGIGTLDEVSIRIRVAIRSLP